MEAALSPLARLWLYRAAVLVHLGAVVVWFGAVAYYPLILRPALRASAVERKAKYVILGAVKARLKIVVGGAVIALAASGLTLGWLRGFVGAGQATGVFHHRLFLVKLALGAALIVVFLTALPLLQQVQVPTRRARLFLATHLVVLALGLIAAGVGILLSR
ncbi:MAG: hypothetical protein HOQ09_05355 [Gemmatimonadaceae bacterium]|nr:hypothetical protein [Gemmatimonadaceae bacterium]